MKWTLGLLFVASVATALPQRGAKAFSLFSVVTFPNDECRTQTAMSGICITAEECTGTGTMVSGNCASGFGVCCFRFVEATQPTGTVNVVNDLTHIRNEGFPTPVGNVAAPAATNLMFPILGDVGICAIRLEFLPTTVFSDPIFDATAGTCGNAAGTTGDSLTVNAGGQQPAFVSLCGTLTGQHIYIDTGRQATGATVIIQTGTNMFPRTWKILVRRLLCTDPNLVGWSPNCLQFFTGLTDSITSLNGGFVGQMLLRSLNYDICIRRLPGMCRLELVEAGGVADSFALQVANPPAGGEAGNSMTGNDGPPGPGAGAQLCAVEGIVIPNSIGCGLNQLTLFPPAACPPIFCGGKLNWLSNQATPSIVTSLDLFGGNTFEIRVRSAGLVASAPETGFDLIYQQAC